MYLLETYVHEYTEQLNKDIEKTVADYLEKQGYTIYEPLVECVKEIQDVLYREGKMLRCEVFTVFDYYNTSARMVCIPFIDECIWHPLPREDIYLIFDLQSKGYRL